MRIIKTFNDWKLNEASYFYKDTLNPNFWTDNNFDPTVRKKLLDIAAEFFASFKLENIAPVDIQLTGSLANYNWNEGSDLDVHVIIDFSKIDDNIDLVKKALDGQRFMWNLRRNIVIKSFDVELYIQDINEIHNASGLFSLLDNKWLRVPKFNPPDIDEKDVTLKFKTLAREIDEIESRLESTKEGEEVTARELFDFGERLKSKIQKNRKQGLAEVGEFSVENLVFKKLRNEGYIEKLIGLISRAYEKIYSE